MDVYIGLDVSLASTAICVLGDKGKMVTEAQVASAPDSLVSFLSELPHGIAAIGLEAGPLSNWLHKGLTDAGFEAVLMETRQVKSALKAMPIKTDRRDAEGIARLLQMGWFRPVHSKTVSSQETRALLTSRKSVKDALLDMELSLRGVLRNFGLKLGQVSKGRWEARVRELIAGNAMLEAAAEPILRARAALRRELAGLEKLVRNLAGDDLVCRLLMTMPGVGPVVALTFASAIDDPGRFRRSKDVGPWVGLTPGRNQSGERDIVGAITKAGDEGLRTALYQAATVMLHRGAPNWLLWGCNNQARNSALATTCVDLPRFSGSEATLARSERLSHRSHAFARTQLLSGRLPAARRWLHPTIPLAAGATFRRRGPSEGRRFSARQFFGHTPPGLAPAASG